MRSSESKLRCRMLGGRKAFTLLELLAVLAILGILVALLLPVVGGYMHKAKAAKCVSNMRQIGIAISLYSSEHNNDLPVQTLDPAPSIYADTNSWVGELKGYVGNNFDVFSCPESTGPYPRVSYLYNAFASTARLSGRSSVKVTSSRSPSTDILVLDQVVAAPNPLTVSFLVDVVENPNCWWWYPHPAKDQKKGARSVLFVDGHSEIVTMGTLDWQQLQWPEE